jgi:hypothetical protein
MKKLFILTFLLVTTAGFSLDWKDCLPKEIPIDSVVNLPPPYKNTEHIRLLETDIKNRAFNFYQEIRDNLKTKYPNYYEIKEETSDKEAETKAFFISVHSHNYCDSLCLFVFRSNRAVWVLVVVTTPKPLPLDDSVDVRVL